VFVKICGVTTEEDALLAVALGADAVGFVFAPSPRQVRPGRVADIVKRLPSDVLTVGVFRDEAPARVVSIVQEAGLKVAQLHGHETPTDTRYVRAHVPLVFKAFVAGDRSLDRFDDFGADVALIDSPAPGSGQMFDWALAEGAPSNRRVLLAGGLDPDNVADAITRVRPWGVDVASGVERAPGHKDPVKLRAFILAAKRAAPKREYVGEGEMPYDWEEDESLWP
jgi:phosphoribosylanthranilate isomerase